jgi:hypothetical protein
MFVFISHSGTDTWIARRIAEGCESAGAGIFLDEAQIAIGAVFETLNQECESHLSASTRVPVRN